MGGCVDIQDRVERLTVNDEAVGRQQDAGGVLRMSRAMPCHVN